MTDQDEKVQDLDKELKKKTAKGAAISIGVGAIAGGGAGLAAGPTAGAALVVGGSIIAAPVAIPAAIGVVSVGLVGTGIAYVAAKVKKKREQQKLLDETKEKLSKILQQMEQDKNEEKTQENEKEILCKEITTIEADMRKQEVSYKKQVEEHGYTRNPSQMIMVMIGKTGHGKSTLGNRICGDGSRKGNEGPFTVSSKKHKAGTTEVISTITTAPFRNMTTDEGMEYNNPTDGNDEYKEGSPDEIELEIIDIEEIQKQPSSLLIVDTPGWGDVDETNRDDHKNLVTRYLKGCGGINSFVMVLSNRDRIDGSIQQMLTEYEKLFGDKFWKHLIIIMTGIDDEDDLEEFEEEEHVIDIQKLLKEKFENLASLNRDVPVIPIGKKIYKKQTPLIIEKISTEKFTCDALKGPYELLQEKYVGLVVDLKAVDDKLVQLKENLSKLAQDKENWQIKIDELENALGKK